MASPDSKQILAVLLLTALVLAPLLEAPPAALGAVVLWVGGLAYAIELVSARVTERVPYYWQAARILVALGSGWALAAAVDGPTDRGAVLAVVVAVAATVAFGYQLLAERATDA